MKKNCPPQFGWAVPDLGDLKKPRLFEVLFE